ncbi:hypothetical protein K474DRAFT_845848 [Panus rudis PR-1116 ss-1]|nr:hypothetical protein K474DRAFT_845848 [Panus rudis PR-1116 ss-1]
MTLSSGNFLYSRDDDGGLSTASIIGIAVACGSVGLLILTLFLWRLISRLCRRERPAPLPPVQALAHHREAHVAAFAERNTSRPTTWLDNASYGSRSKVRLHAAATASDVSLIPGTSERKASIYTDEATTAESALTLSSPLSSNDLSLPPPHPHFLAGQLSTPSPHTSLTSMSSSIASEEISPSSMFPSTSLPTSETASTASHFVPRSNSHHPLQSTSRSPLPHSTSRSVSRQRSRPTSMVSMAGTTYSARTAGGSVIRGAPHGPYSNVQIVLPAPLDPKAYSQMDPLHEGNISTFALTDASVSRMSVADPWVLVGTSSTPRSQCKWLLPQLPVTPLTPVRR